MSRTIRRGKPSRDYHKYIGLGTIRHENERTHVCVSYPGGWHHEISVEPRWTGDGHLTYEDYAKENIRNYHMDFKPWHKTPSFCFRVEVQRQKRRHREALHHALRNGREDELFMERVRQDMQWMWD